MLSAARTPVLVSCCFFFFVYENKSISESVREASRAYWVEAARIGCARAFGPTGSRCVRACVSHVTDPPAATLTFKGHARTHKCNDEPASPRARVSDGSHSENPFVPMCILRPVARFLNTYTCAYDTVTHTHTCSFPMRLCAWYSCKCAPCVPSRVGGCRDTATH